MIDKTFLDELSLEVMPYTKALLILFETHNSDRDTINISNDYLKQSLMALNNKRKINEIFLNESLFNGDYIDYISELNFYNTPLTKKLLEEYIKWEYEEAADISFKSLKEELIALYHKGNLGALIASEWAFARPI